MTTTTAPPASEERNGWPVVGLFLDALTRRDFAALQLCLDDEVRFRALVPRGPFELTGSTDAADRFRLWFGGEDYFEVVDASVGQLGSKLYARWRIRMVAADDPDSARVVEQHVFTTGTDRVETLDLLCSGFHAESAAPTCPLP